MKKIIMCIAIIGCLFFTGCEAEGEQQGRMRTISREELGYIVYDTWTGVTYWESCGSYNCGRLTVMVDAEGKPLIYKGE